MALAIVVNAKTQRTSVCNAAESLLVHADVADDVPAAGRRAPCRTPGVTVHGDDGASRRTTGWSPATDEDWARSTSPSTSPPRVVARPRRGDRAHPPLVEPATPRRSSPSDQAAARRFVAEVDSAAVLVNASTRFTDGGEFGFGAEIGISTQKLHARGPMGLPEMTSTKYVVTGDGHVRVSRHARSGRAVRA